MRSVPDLAVAGGPVPELSVDLLVPSLDGRFHPQEYGGRAFDSAPGLESALATEPIVIDARMTLLNRSAIECTVRVPTVELALVIKALSYGLRLQDRDIEDIYRLLEIATFYPADDIGGWQLRSTGLCGSRRDAAARLHELARRTRRHLDIDVPPARLAALIASCVSRNT